VVLPPALIIAAPASGSGKTTLTLALLRHFRTQGLAVASFKVGPDFIDPTFHRAAGGWPSYNLDGWAMGPARLSALVARAGQDAELIIGEGVMGLFDGAPDGTGSTADLGALMGLPVVLVVDASAQAASAAAVVHGFASFRDDVRVAGVIFNRVGSEGHVRALTAACRGLDVAVLGCLPWRRELEMPERHLGLVQAMEHADLEGFLDAAAAQVSEHVDTAAVRALAKPPALPPPGEVPSLPPLGRRIALADDAAFAFTYPHLLDDWRHAGAEIVSFSPLADETPDPDADAVFLPGGYPELHAGRLAANRNFLHGLRQAADRDAVVYGECGGYMLLGQGLVDADGARHAMAGLLGVETSFAERRMHLGYRFARLETDGPLGAAGARFRAHEFHFASVLDEGTEAPLFTCTDALGLDLGPVGRRRGMVMGSFLHLIDLA
jgi:cobyrinic acid a,c-diamide synthase